MKKLIEGCVPRLEAPSRRLTVIADYLACPRRLPFYQDKLYEEKVFKRFAEILSKARSNKQANKPDAELNEFETVRSFAVPPGSLSVDPPFPPDPRKPQEERRRWPGARCCRCQDGSGRDAPQSGDEWQEGRAGQACECVLSLSSPSLAARSPAEARPCSLQLATAERRIATTTTTTSSPQPSPRHARSRVRRPICRLFLHLTDARRVKPLCQPARGASGSSRVRTRT